MTRTFEEMCKVRDPLYAATRARTMFLRALVCDEDAEEFAAQGHPTIAKVSQLERNGWLLKLAIRALRNQGQPYYDAR